MADWSDYYFGQRVDFLARFVALRHHDVRVGGSFPGLSSSNTVTLQNVIRCINAKMGAQPSKR